MISINEIVNFGKISFNPGILVLYMAYGKEPSILLSFTQQPIELKRKIGFCTQLGSLSLRPINGD